MVCSLVCLQTVAQKRPKRPLGVVKRCWDAEISFLRRLGLPLDAPRHVPASIPIDPYPGWKFRNDRLRQADFERFAAVSVRQGCQPWNRQVLDPTGFLGQAAVSVAAAFQTRNPR